MLERYTRQGDCDNLLSDVFSSKKFAKVLPSVRVTGPAEAADDKLLKSIAEDYANSKERETNELIRKQGARIQSKLLIGKTMTSSKISLEAHFTSGSNRTEAAKRLGHVAVSGDERRRLLSIVAWDFKYSKLQEYFGCSKSTITAARIHAILFGRGGTPKDGIKFTRQVISNDGIDEFSEFINQDDIARPSSCRSILVDGKETAIRYW